MEQIKYLYIIKYKYKGIEQKQETTISGVAASWLLDLDATKNVTHLRLERVRYVTQYNLKFMCEE